MAKIAEKYFIFLTNHQPSYQSSYEDKLTIQQAFKVPIVLLSNCQRGVYDLTNELKAPLEAIDKWTYEEVIGFEPDES
jgi:hypothetical protein